MKRLPIVECWSVQGDLYAITGEGSMLNCYNTFIIALDESGTEWIHKVCVPGHNEGLEFNFPNSGATAQAEERVKRILKRGSIDPKYWDEYQRPVSDFETHYEPFGPAWEEEQRERHPNW